MKSWQPEKFSICKRYPLCILCTSVCVGSLRRLQYIHGTHIGVYVRFLIGLLLQCMGKLNWMPSRMF